MPNFYNTHSLSKDLQSDLFRGTPGLGEQLTPSRVHLAEGVVDAHDRQKRDFLTASQAGKLLEGRQRRPLRAQGPRSAAGDLQTRFAGL
jgi:hypothetical protein